MADDTRPVIIKPTVDASGVRPGVEQTKKAVNEMATSVKASGEKAGQGVEEVGKGAKRAADTTARETGRIRAALERLQNEQRAGGRNTADYFELEAKRRGADLNALKPALDSARAFEAAQRAATGSLDAIGMSAKQTNAALRQVPAQFTDIVVALQGGQAPLTVFLQQGGQLKDVFGGAGAAAQALGRYIIGLISPVTAAAAILATLAFGFVKGSRESEQYQRAIIETGNAAGTTRDQLASMAKAISNGDITQAKAAQVLTQIAKSGDVASSSLERFTRTAIEMERSGGQAADETAKAFSQLAKDPLTASLRLTEQMRYLDTATAEQIQTLERQGRTVEAARLAQDAYANALEQRAPQMLGTLGLVERSWIGIKDAIKSAGDAILEVGRQDALGDQLAKLERYRANARQLGVRGLTARADGGPVSDSPVDRQIEALQETIRLSNRSAAAQAEVTQQRKAGLEYLKEADKYLSKEVKFANELARIKNLGLAAGRSSEEIAALMTQASKNFYGAPKKTASKPWETDSLLVFQAEELRNALEAIEKVNREWKPVVYVNPADVHEAELLRKAFEEIAVVNKQAEEAAKQAERDLVRDQARQAKRETESLGRDIGLVFTSAAGEAIREWQGFRELINSIGKDLLQLSYKLLVAKPIENALSQTIGGAGGFNLAKFVSGIFGGFLAEGGPVSTGRAYVVGERGPELFVPKSAGTIVPNGAAMGDATPMVFNIDARGADQGVEMRIRQGVREAVAQAVATVQAKANRGGSFARSMGRA